MLLSAPVRRVVGYDLPNRVKRWPADCCPGDASPYAAHRCRLSEALLLLDPPLEPCETVPAIQTERDHCAAKEADDIDEPYWSTKFDLLYQGVDQLMQSAYYAARLDAVPR